MSETLAIAVSRLWPGRPVSLRREGPWSRPVTPAWLDPYVGGLVIALAALAVRSLMVPWIEVGTTTPMMLTAVALAAYAFGLRPALVTLVMCAVLFKYLFMGPRLSLYIPGWENRLSYAAFIAGNLGVAVLFQRMRRLVDRLRSQRELLCRLIDVQEREKQSLCNEFHDGLVQYAVGARMLLESHREAHPHEAAAETIDTVIAYLQRGIEDGRRALRGIRPAVLDDGDLADAVNDLVDQFRSLGLDVRLEFSVPAGRLPERFQTTVYRVIQEALSNARRHSGTTAVDVRVAATGRALSIEVADQGRGFDVGHRSTGGFGLRGMAERIRLAGGFCGIQSRPGAGTRISATLPLPARNGPASGTAEVAAETLSPWDVDEAAPPDRVEFPPAPASA